MNSFLLGRAHPVELRRSVDVLNLLDRDARFERFEGLVVERLDSLEHPVGFLGFAVGVDVVERVLLEPGLTDVACDLHRELLVLRQRVLADELDDLLKLVLLV